MSSRNAPPHKRLLTFEQHSFPPFQPIIIWVTYFENCARQRNLTNHFDCFILEFTAFKIAIAEEVFDVVRQTIQISSLLLFSITYEVWNSTSTNGFILVYGFRNRQPSKRTSQETEVNFSRVKRSVCQLWLVDFDPFCLFLLYTVRCLMTAAKNAVVWISHVIERRNKRTAKNLELGKSLKKERMFLSSYQRVSENIGL